MAAVANPAKRYHPDHGGVTPQPGVGVGGGLQPVVTTFDLINDRGVLGGRAERLGLLGQGVVGHPDPGGGGPQLGRFRLRQAPDQLIALSAGGQVRTGEAQVAARRALVEPLLGQEVDAPVGRGELGAHILGGVDVDHEVLAGLGPKDGQAASVVLYQLHMDPRSSAPQGAEELADQSISLCVANAGDHGETGMDDQREPIRACLYNHPLETHTLSIGPGSDELSPPSRQSPRFVVDWPLMSASPRADGGLGLVLCPPHQTTWGADGTGGYHQVSLGPGFGRAPAPS